MYSILLVLIPLNFRAFLVRDSSDDCHLLSLSFRSYGRTLHTRIEHSHGFFSFYAYPEAEQHSSVGQLIEHLMDTSRSGIFCYSRYLTTITNFQIPVRYLFLHFIKVSFTRVSVLSSSIDQSCFSLFWSAAFAVHVPFRHSKLCANGSHWKTSFARIP